MAIMAQNINQKPGYKLTEIGMIPERWEVKKLGDVVEFLDGRRKPISERDRVKIDGEYPYYGASGIVDYVNNYIFDEELILLGEDGENILSRNCRLAFRVSGKIWVNNHAHVLRPKTNTDINFLCEYLENLDYEQYNTGTAQPKLNKKTCSAITVLLPSPTEQHAIATALSDIDALITALDNLIIKKHDIKQATMQQLLTGKMRLPGFSGGAELIYKQTEIGLIPSDWDVHSVEEIADVTTGDKDTQDRTESGLYPFFVRSQTIERINSYSYDGEAVLTAGDGVGVGKVFHYVNGKFDFHQRVYMICNFRNFDGFFFYLYFSIYFSKEATKYNAKNSVDSVRREMITGMKIPYPSLPEQQAIATVLTDMDAEIAALEQRREKTRMLKQGMMQELLTGKTRLL